METLVQLQEIAVNRLSCPALKDCSPESFALGRAMIRVLVIIILPTPN